MKLTGCTISCAHIPHVQSYFLATDFVGLKVLFSPNATEHAQSKGIFYCYSVKDDVSIHSEVASSTRLLQHGYQIDSLLTKYQRVNFQKT